MIKTIEGYTEFDLPDNFEIKDQQGWSAMMRIRNEEEFIVPCLLAIRNLFDEIIIVLNDTTDRTKELIEKMKLPNVKLYEYPFQVIATGPQQVNIPINSVYSAIHYYRWSVSKVTRNFMTRWDGDNIALANFTQTRQLVYSDNYDVIWNVGWDLVGSNANQLGSQQRVAYEQRTHRLDGTITVGFNANRYTHGLNYTRQQREIKISSPDFLHMKWCKKDPCHQWRDKFGDSFATIPHYANIAQRHKPQINYMGPYPQVLIDYYKLGKNPIDLISMYKDESSRNALAIGNNL